MGCKQFEEMISDYIDGALEAGEQTAVERHLADCEGCRALRDDLLQLVHFSRHLPQHTPSSTVWTAIQTQVKAESRAGLRQRVARWLARWEERNFLLSLPQLAAGAVALILVALVVSILLRREAQQPGETASAPASSAISKNLLSYPDLRQIEERISQLESSVEQRKASWTDDLRQAYERNLAYVNQSLIECRQQVSGHPEDKVSEELMLNAYREKVRLLEGFEAF
ncbi:MAG: zf-HC2 domain-containing protein [Acidobacteriota bacterium]